MKKTISVLLAIITAMTLLATAAFASDRGEEITVTVSVGSYSSVTSGAVELTYDHDVLELVSGTVLIPDIIGDFDAANDDGVFFAMSAFSVSGDILTAVFRVRSDAAVGASTEIKATVWMNDSEITETVTCGRVTVTSSAPVSEPTHEPSSDPTIAPATEPPSDPTTSPKTEPTAEPASSPEIDPTSEPTAGPTSTPEIDPTADPSSDPTEPADQPDPKKSPLGIIAAVIAVPAAVATAIGAFVVTRKKK